MTCNKCPGSESQAACDECKTKNPTKTVYILRGPSGAGKTTFQQNTWPKAWVCSADDYFDCGVEYEFDPRKLPEAHMSCMSMFLQGLKKHSPVIVVDNTNIRRCEWINYKYIAELVGYDVRVIEFMPNTIKQLRIIADRNVHRVPQSVIADMAMRFQPHKDADSFEAAVE